ncbi:MAG: sulfatase [Bryobacteraceae bacterium]
MLTRRSLLQGLLPAALAARPAAPRPNFIYVLTDDLGYGDLGCYGSRAIRTPRLDAMAREGVRFTQFYSGSSLCTPARASFITGRYSPRVGRLIHPLQPTNDYGLPASEVTIAETLRGAGYTSACIGKWHLGHLPQFLPTNHGFDYWYGLPYSNDLKPLPLMRNLETLTTEVDQARLTDDYTKESVAFIERAAAAKKPFFLYLAHTMPHDPLHAPERFRGKSEGGLYGDVVENIDWSMGEVLAALKRLNLDRETLVMFTSDNGPWWEGSAGPLRGRKAEQYEGGFRVPFIARWPGRIAPGQVCETPAMAINMHPTFAALAGTRVDPAAGLDGRDMSSLLLGRTRACPNEIFLFFYREHLHAARMGNWKLHLAALTRAPYMRLRAFREGGAEKRSEAKLPEPQLYDLSLDPYESYNVAPEHPEVVRSITERVRAELAAYPEHVRKAQLI